MAQPAPQPDPKSSAFHIRDITARFVSSERGTLTIFGLFILVMMLIASGMAIDIVRHEQKRVRIQSTLDRAVLAAGAMSQTQPAEAVVREYIDKAGLSGDLSVTIPPATSTGGFKSVRVKATQDLDMMFLNMVGIPTMAVNAYSVAEQAASDIEISMVLDISGSMSKVSKGGKTRIENLREASEAFVDLILDGPAIHTTTINLVPYAGGVNTGPYVFDRVGGVRRHGYSNCLHLEESEFTHTGLPTASSMQVAHFTHYNFNRAIVDWGWCPNDEAAMIVHSNNRSALIDRIRTMPMFDGTGTPIGMKWGLALLDPSANGLIRSMDGQGMSYTADLYTDPAAVVGQPNIFNTNANFVPDAFEDRPAAWTDANTKKYILLMTDGRITKQARPTYLGHRDTDEDDFDNEPDIDNVDGTHHDFEQARRRINNKIEVTRISTHAQNVDRFEAICNMAKANDITVYTVAYEVDSIANANITKQMRECASTESHFYDVAGIDITKAFSAIARQIYQLRLTN